jgi:hypothetical protein
MRAATLMKYDVKKEERSLYCPTCEIEMHRLPGSLTSIYICNKCGCSIEPEETFENITNVDPIENKFSENITEGEKCLEKLLTPKFMKKYTNYDNFDDFIFASKLLPKNATSFSYEIFKTIPITKLDNFVRANSVFDTWDEMFDSATGRYLRI